MKATRRKSEKRLRQLVGTLAGIVDKRDPTTSHRSNNTGEVARAIAEALGMDKIEADTAEFAGALRYVGSVLKDNPELDDSAALLEEIDFEGPVVDAIRQSGENFDGSGPAGLTGEEALLSARIVTVANAFLSLCNPSDGSPEMSFEEAGNKLLLESGAKYDRKAVTALLNYIENSGGAEKWQNFSPST